VIRNPQFVTSDRLRRRTNDFYGIDWRRTGILVCRHFRSARKDLKRADQIDDFRTRRGHEHDPPRYASGAAVCVDFESLFLRQNETESRLGIRAILLILSCNFFSGCVREFIGCRVESFPIVVGTEIVGLAL